MTIANRYPHPLIIRPVGRGDTDGMAALYRRSVEALGPKAYSADQVAVWAGLQPTPERLAALAADGRTALVAVDPSGRLLAFGDREVDGHIHFLYCDPSVAGRGVTAALYEALEADARQAGVVRLYTEASELARRFFRKQGFVEIARRDFTVSGVAIHNYAMEKRLASTP